MNGIHEAKPGTVSILIGPNGSGKSRRLRKLCDDALCEGMKVIAIAPTIYDRFLKIRSPNFRFFGARQGRSASKNIVRDLIVRAAGDDPKILKNLVQALKHTRFDPSVGVSIGWVDFDRFEEVSRKMANELELDPLEQRDLEFALRRWDRGRDRVRWQPLDAEFPWDDQGEWKGHTILKLSMEEFSFHELHRITYVSLLRYESALVKWKIIERPKYYFFRDNLPIPLLEACSGELCFISSIAFMTAEIDGNCCIMVDEPENSLHPTWQKSYVSTILDLFYNYQPRIVITTHSPIIVSGGELADQKTRVYEMRDSGVDEYLNPNLNLEEMYEQLFDLITPKNRYLSTRAVELLDAVNEGTLDAVGAKKILNALSDKRYDDQQIRMIEGVAALAEKVEKTRRKND